MLTRLTTLLLAALVGSTVQACATASKDRSMEVERHPTEQRRSNTLMVLLPGAGDAPAAYVDNGFVGALSETRGDIDVIAVDAHASYYFGRTIVDRLREDVILPARAEGYEQIWLVGISMGGFGALLFSQHHGELIDGLVVLAPYLGKGRTLRPIDAVGVRDWEPDASEGNYSYELWRWLKGYQDRVSSPGHPPLYLGYGLDDRSARAHALLSDLLPDDHTFTREGGHDWNVWTPLWQRILASAALPPAPQ